MAVQENDHQILLELQRDATLSLKELGERVAMSPSTVWRRIQDLEADGVITGRVTLVDPVRMGRTVCVLVDVNITQHRPEVRREFEAFVAGNEAILQCFAVSGAHDYTLIVRTRTVEDYESFLMNELLAHPSVASSATHLVLRQHKNTTIIPP